MPPFANVGLPMVCETVPTMLVGLPLIAAVEAFVYARLLRRTFKDAFRGAMAANFYSTVIGIPVVWVPCVLCQFAAGGSRGMPLDTEEQRWHAVLFHAAWMLPYEEHLGWLIPAAAMLMLVPFYL